MRAIAVNEYAAHRRRHVVQRVVESIGEGTAKFAPGDEVFGHAVLSSLVRSGGSGAHPGGKTVIML